MTPEERFERIEKTLDRMEADRHRSQRDHEAQQAEREAILDRMLVTTTLLDRAQAEHIARFEKIERALDFIASSQASLSESMRHLVDSFDSHRRNPRGHDE